MLILNYNAEEKKMKYRAVTMPQSVWYVKAVPQYDYMPKCKWVYDVTVPFDMVNSDAHQRLVNETDGANPAMYRFIFEICRVERSDFGIVYFSEQ